MTDIRKTICWADWSTNEVWGCLNNCPYCYARFIAKRFGKQICGRSDFVPTWIESNFNKTIPNYATHIFINSMSDVAFWKQDWFDKVLQKAVNLPEKKFLFLTKRMDFVALKVMYSKIKKVSNVYFGATVTRNSEFIISADFVSIEPIHERIDVAKLIYYKQVIVGAETGNRKGKIIPEAAWIEEIRIFCKKSGIKLFEKNSLKDIVKRELIQERI